MFRRTAAFLFFLTLGTLFVHSTQSSNPTAHAMGGGDGWRAEYYNNTTWDGAPVLVRTEGSVNNWWGKESPAPGVDADFFSVRWTAPLILSEARTIRFKTTADDTLRLMIDGEVISQHNVAGKVKTVERTVAAGQHEITIEYVEYVGDAIAIFEMQTVKNEPPPSSSIGAWTAQYFNNTSLEGQPDATDSTNRIYYDWGNGAAKPGLSADYFSARWTRTDSIQSPMRYTFAATADDSVVVKVDGKVIMDTRSGAPWQTQIARIELQPGSHQFVVEFIEQTHYAFVDVEVDRLVLEQAPPQAPQINHFTVDKTWASNDDTVTLSWDIDFAESVSIHPQKMPDSLHSISVNPVGTLNFKMSNFCDGDGQVSFTIKARNKSGQQVEATQTVATPAYDWFFHFKDGSDPGVGPCDPARQSAAAQQRFERGWMLWIDSKDTIYVFYDADEQGNRYWESYGDSFDESSAPHSSTLTPPEGLEAPVRGFGKLWRSNEHVRNKLGWAVEGERGFTSTYQAQVAYYGNRSSSLTFFSSAHGEVFGLSNSTSAGPSNFWSLTPFDWK